MAKQTAISETSFWCSGKKKVKEIKIEFERFGMKGGKNTKELFWVKSHNKVTGDIQELKSLTLTDLKRIAEDAEMLIRIADGEDITKL